jgi:hypothetical protein
MYKLLAYIAAAVLFGAVVIGLYMVLKKRDKGGNYPNPPDPMDNYSVTQNSVERNLLPNENRDLDLIPNSSPRDCAMRCNASELCDAFVFNPLGSYKFPGSINACILKSKSLNSDVCTNFKIVDPPDMNKGIFIACKRK